MTRWHRTIEFIDDVDESEFDTNCIWLKWHNMIFKKKQPFKKSRVGSRGNSMELLEGRWLLFSDWRNPIQPADVNNDLLVSSVDALLVVNRLNQGPRIEFSGVKPPLEPFTDTNGDRRVSPVDALRVINFLNREPLENRGIKRIEGQSAPGPAGFLSLPMTRLPGRSGQIVPLATTLMIGREEFNEMGIFVADDATGTVKGIAPGQAGYKEAVFLQSERRILYSQFDTFRAAREATLPGGAFAHVYVLQGNSESSEPQDHLRVRQISTNRLRVGWEEHVSPLNRWISVGDRSYDDATVDFQIGVPIDGNAEPVIGSIPDRTINELTELDITALVTDTDLPRDTIKYTLDVAPTGAAIDQATGRITWTPTEAHGPGNFEFVVRATDVAGAFDTESFFVTVLEVNQAPVLSVPFNLEINRGNTLSIQAVATDADLPAQKLTFSLLPGTPAGVKIDSATGDLRWEVPANQPSGSYQIGVRVSDSATPALSDNKTIAVAIDCDFDANLTGWRVFESGGIGTAKGGVIGSNCSATIREGNSFLAGIERTFSIPKGLASLAFSYNDLTFDSTAANAVKDAFEAAVLDRDGNPLVASFMPGRDAFFNLTDGLPPALGPRTRQDGNIITVELDGIPVNTEARLVFRMVNNDSDRLSRVSLSEIRFVIDSSIRSFLQVDGSTTQSRSVGVSTSGAMFNRTHVGNEGGAAGWASVEGSHDRVHTLQSTGSGSSMGTPKIAPFYYVDWQTADPSKGKASGVITLADGSQVSVDFVAKNPDGTPGSFKFANTDGGTNFWNPVEPYESETVPNAPPDSDIVSLIGGQGQTYIVTLSEPIKDPIMAIVSLGNFSEIVDYQFDSPFEIVSQGSGYFGGNDHSLSQNGNTLTGAEGHGTIRFLGTFETFQWTVPRPENWHGFTFGIRNSVALDPRLLISASLPFDRARAGSTFVLSGIATASGVTHGGQPNGVSSVFVNGKPVMVLDSAGNFFEPWEVSPGLNRLLVTADDATGRTAQVVLEVFGTSENSVIDFSRQTDITGSFRGAYFRTSFNDQTNLLHVDLAMRNDGQFATDVPLFVGVKNISDPSVSLVDIDGLTPDGIPYYDYSAFATGGRLAPGQWTESPTLLFHNPQRVRFDYELVFYGKLNEPPVIMTPPVIEALVNRPYRYQVDATDTDQDRLSYSLATAPVGMAIDTATGSITWTPDSSQLGQYQVTVQVADHRGGLAEQIFWLSVIPAPPNRPPVFVTTPVVDVPFGEPYRYDSRAIDADDDPLRFSLVAGPRGLSIDRSTGQVEWRTDAPQVSEFIAIDMSPIANSRLQELAQVAPDYPNGSFVASGIPFFIPETGSNIWHSAFQAGSNPIVGELKVGQTGVSTVHALINTYWGQPGPASYAAVEFVGTQGKTIRQPLLGNVDIRDYLQNFFTNEINNTTTTAAFSGTSQTNRPVRLDLVRFSLPATFQNEPLESIRFIDNGGDGFQRIFVAGVTIEKTSRTSNVGHFPVTIAVEDGRGGNATQEFVICVAPDPANHPPVMISNPRAILPVNEFIPGDQNDFMFTVPGVVNEPVDATFNWTIRGAAYNNEFGIYRVHDERGVVDGTGPGEAGYSRKALSETNSIVIFESGLGAGATKTVTLRGGERYAFYIVQNSTTPLFRANNPDNLLSGAPLAFLSFPTANPDGIDHLIATQTVSGETQFAWEDLTGVGDFSNPANFKDVVFTIDLLLLPGARKEWQYQPEAIDIDGDQVTYSLLNAPSGASIHAETGKVTWLADRGTHPFTIRAADGRGGFDDQSFQLMVVTGTRVRGTSFDVSNSQSAVEGLAGRVVYVDENRNGKRDDGEAWSLTDVSGQYVLDGLLPGTHLIRQLPLRGWKQITPQAPEGGHWITILHEQSIDGVNFDNQKITLSVNSEPALTSIPALSAVSGEVFSHSVQASDPDYDPLQFALPTAPDGMTIHPERGVIVWLPREGQLGEHQVIVRVQDDRGGVALQSFTITVSLPNHAPVITSQRATWAIAGRHLTHRLRAQDADGDALVFALHGAPSGMSIDTIELHDSTGQRMERFHQLRWDVPQDAAGSTAAFTIHVTDGRGGEVIQPWSLQVLDQNTANTAPVFTSTPGTTARAGRTWIYLPVVNDLEGDATSFRLLQKPENMTITADGLVSWTPPGNALTTVTVSIRATDERGGEATQTFELAVATIEQNSPPVITSVPPTRTLEAHLFRYDAAAIDGDADRLTWSLLLAPRGMSIDSESGAIRWIPDEMQLGSHQVAVRVTDPFLGQFTQRFALQVTCSNLPPAVLSVPPTTALTTRMYLYAPRAFDPEQNVLSWSLTTKPPGMTIDDRTGVIRWTPIAGQVGSHDVSIEVRDGALRGRQDYRIIVSSLSNDSEANRPPLITSTPLFSGEVGSTYQYRVMAIDPDGDTVGFELSRTPPGMTITADGLISWNPSEANVGEHRIGITVTDSRGAIAAQGFLLSITKNQTPVITSTPVVSSVAGSTYRYSVRASDPDADPLTYRLSAAPRGMTIDPYGRILWASPATLTAPQDVTIVVSDNRGQTATQSYTIDMLADTEAPRVRLAISTADGAFANQATIDAGSLYTVRVFATDNIAVSQIGLLVNGQPVTLSATGSVALSASAVGAVQLLGFARDSAGLRGEVSGSVTIVVAGQSNPPTPGDPTLPQHPEFDPTDQGTPLVQITSPAPGTAVTNRVPIIGTVDDPEDNLWFYRVLYARADRVSITNIDLADPDWLVFAVSTSEVIDGELATFDASDLTNDPYAIIVAGYDVNGRGYVAATLVYVEGNVIIGNFRLEFTDLTLPLAGIPIQVSRVYDTLNAADEGSFGFGWSPGVQDARIFEAAAIGAGGVLHGGSNVFIPDKTKVYLTTPSGQRVGFTYKEAYSSGAAILIGCAFGCLYRPYFQADPGVYDTLTIDETQVARGGLLGALTAGINPEFYNLVTKDGMIYRYHDVRGLEKVTDRHGNFVTYSKDGIRHSLGEEVRFVRDHRGRITEIIAPDGKKLTYEYNASGDLVRFTDQAALTTTYEYLGKPAHYLDAAYDTLNRRLMKAQYDADFRFVGIFDALGNQVDQRDFTTDNNTGIVRDSNGNPTRLVYDHRGNVVEELDSQGNKTIRRYEDPRHPDLETMLIDRRGYVIERSYDARGNLLSVTERGTSANPLPKPVATTFSYNTRNDITSITNANGESTFFEYDVQGNVIKIINALGASSTFTYDSQGRRTSFTDFNGEQTFIEYHAGCACGSPSRVVHPDGDYQTYQYNDFGQVLLQQTFEDNGVLVERKQFEYDALGRVTREVMGGGNDPRHPATDVRRFYNNQLLAWEVIVHPDSLDADGNLLESPATPIPTRKSRITEYRYDARDRLITRVDAMGGAVDFRYDAQGNRVLLRDPVGNITTWFYDSLNRMTEERDPFYWVAFVAANATLSKDAMLDAVVEENKKPSSASLTSNQGAAHVRSFAYDSEGNQTKIIDRNNRRREFSYDHAGRLLEERWYNPINHSTAPGALVETIAFTHDLLGNVLTAVDSKSRYWYFYDELNRLTRVDNNPLNDRDVPRVILSYGYDAQGNTISTSDDAGVTVSSEYDSRNRLKSRRWFDADVAAGTTADVAEARVDFLYTAAGREREVRRYANLTDRQLVGKTLRTFDLSGRSNLLNHVNAVDQVIAGYDYDYDFSDRLAGEKRSHQDSQFAQAIQYNYDLTGQLVEALFEIQEDEFYEYDLNGNRKSATLGDQTSIYAPPGPANQLTSDGTYDYLYDGEGNMVKRIHRMTGETTTFGYDHRNRMVTVDTWSRNPDAELPAEKAILTRSAKYTVDMFSRTIAKNYHSFDGANRVFQSEQSVFDGNNKWSVSLNANAEKERMLFGDRVDRILMASKSISDQKWFIFDSVGSVTGSTGNSFDTIENYGFSAFGIPTTSHESRFMGRPYDTHAELLDFRTRAYDPQAGRFASRDVIGFDGGDSNLTRFVGNSPLNFVDPSGAAAIISYASVLESGINRYAAALIGSLHGFGATNLIAVGAVLETWGDLRAAFELTARRVDEINCNLQRMVGISEMGQAFDHVRSGVGQIVSGYVLGGGISLRQLLPPPLDRPSRGMIGAYRSLRCTGIPYTSLRGGGFIQGSEYGLDRLQEVWGL